MRLLKARESLKNTIKAFIFSSYILSILLIILGIILITLRSHIINNITYIAIALFINLALFSLILFMGYFKYKNKIFLIIFIFNLLLIILSTIFIIIHPNNVLDLVAIFMGISAILNFLEIISLLFFERKIIKKSEKIINFITALIEIYFTISLFTNLGASVETHLIIFGIVYIIKGILSILKLIYTNKRIEE